MVELTKESWGKAKTKRVEKYAFWYNRSIQQGASKEEATKIAKQRRDWGYESAKRSLTIGPQRPNPAYKNKRFWSQLSYYWQAETPAEKEQYYRGWEKWQRTASKKWLKEAKQINKSIYAEQPEGYRKLVSWREAKNFSAGYACVYRHYIDGLSWEDVRKYAVFDEFIEDEIDFTDDEYD